MVWVLLTLLARLTTNPQNSFKIGRSTFYVWSKSIHKIKDWPSFISVSPLCWSTGSKDITPAWSSASVQGVPLPLTGQGWRAPLGIHYLAQLPAQSRVTDGWLLRAVAQSGFQKSGLIFFTSSCQVVIFIDDIPLSPPSSQLKVFHDLGNGLICLPMHGFVSLLG